MSVASSFDRAKAEWPARAYVSAGGELAQFDSRSGLARVEADGEIATYARALLFSERRQASFIWIGRDKGWMSVRLSREADPSPTPRTGVEIEDIAPPFALTLRELDVLTLLAAGLGNEAIATRLAVSPRTITKHVENIFAKTEIATRAGAAAMAIDRGYLRLPTPGGGIGAPLPTGEIEAIAQRLDTPGTEPKPRILSRRPVLVGMPLALSGRGALDAAQMLNGARMAVTEINARGGILGRELRLVVSDCDVGDRASVIDSYSELIEKDVDAITGGYSCAEPAIHDLVAEFGAPYLHAATMQSAVEPVRQEPGRLGNIFQVCASDVTYGAGLVRFLGELTQPGSWKPRNKRLAIIQPHWPGLNVGLERIDAGLARRGWQMEIISDLAISDIDWRAVIARLHRLDPSLVVLASYFAEDGIAFQRAFRRQPLPALVYMLYSPSVPAFRQELGAAAEGVVWATTTGLYSDRLGRDFARRYQALHGHAAGRSHASIAYDRIHILAGAWSRAGGARQFDKVIADLRTSVHRGANGSYFFGTPGQVGLAFPDDTADPSISQAQLVFQIQNGEQRILSPQPYADSVFIPPSWMRL
ncbi:ABC transporter substrate-binding protein [Afifella pfennigii]|uniref:ABC transporter substrate-binding protein n=1 Tax=Afifella pfennigii TaxID=209897 RepID=UPI00047ADBDC|nr:ABC transporter substrate-binding protein [Afifella pfennigii]